MKTYEGKFVVDLMVCIILKISELKFLMTKQQTSFLAHLYNIVAQSQTAGPRAMQ